MRRNAGFGIVEALVSMFIIVMLLISLISVFSYARKAIQGSENRVNAAFLGKSLLEDLRSKGFNAITASNGTYSFTGTDNGSPFTFNVTYTVNVTVLDTNKKQVWITINWSEKKINRSVTVETIVVAQ